MTRRTKILLGVLAVLLILILVLLWWLLTRPAGVEQPDPAVNGQLPIPTILPVSDNLINNGVEVEMSEPKVEATLKAVAITFAERYGSYSTESNFENLSDIQPLMTLRMRGDTQAFITQRLSEQPSEVFYGVSTAALNARIVEFDESIRRAEVIVSTQRQESKGTNINPRVFYQDLFLTMIELEGGWKVDEANWQ